MSGFSGIGRRAGEALFWPPADELDETADAIRARLGNWPRPAAAARICLAEPVQPGPGDLLVLGDGPAEAPRQAAWLAAWLAAGAGVLEVEPATVTLRLGGATYALQGERSDDWLAALAAFLDCDFTVPDALCLALAWRSGDAATATAVDAWPADLARFPRVLGLPVAPAPFAVCPHDLGLYPVVPTAEWVERLLPLGVQTLQLREKSAEPAQLDREIRRAVAATRDTGARFFVNDHWQRAIDAGAYGVHLGQEDLQVADLHAISASGLRLGLSTHGYYEMLLALHFRPSYLAMGAVFPTTTKSMPTQPQGLAKLARYVRLLDGVVPLVAIGGIDGVALPAVLASGVRSAAVVRAVTQAANLQQAVAALQQEFHS
jgi:thiamine-phosphate pyrophosphorylase